MGYDIIGDIHGHARALEALLSDMGYRQENGAWRPPSGRMAVFVGDYIDRGPQQVESVKIVRRMVDAGYAYAIMGNHEFNAIAWFTEDPDMPGEYLRRHHSAKYGDKNFQQHKAFLDEVNGTPCHKDIIQWFKTLPMWLDLDGIRVVHACWHQRFMDYIAPRLDAGNRITDAVLIEASREPADAVEKENPEPTPFKAIEALCKGIEVKLPAGHKFNDKDGHERHAVRTRWWDREATTYRQAALLSEELLQSLPDQLLPDHARIHPGEDKPVFFGHYWWAGEPAVLSSTATCVDYSIARGGKLVAYRWDGESSLSSRNFHWLRR